MFFFSYIDIYTHRCYSFISVQNPVVPLCVLHWIHPAACIVHWSLRAVPCTRRPVHVYEDLLWCLLVDLHLKYSSLHSSPSRSSFHLVYNLQSITILDSHWVNCSWCVFMKSEDFLQKKIFIFINGCIKCGLLAVVSYFFL